MFILKAKKIKFESKGRIDSTFRLPGVYTSSSRSDSVQGLDEILGTKSVKESSYISMVVGQILAQVGKLVVANTPITLQAV